MTSFPVREVVSINGSSRDNLLALAAVAARLLLINLNFRSISATGKIGLNK